MTRSQLAEVESALGIALPEGFRQFASTHAKTLKAARKALRDEVVFETSAKPIIKLNKDLRKHGIEVDGRPAPWPGEYLALSDNGAGDHECIKLDEADGAVYRFDGESGLFEPAFPSLPHYLDGLKQKLDHYTRSPRGMSNAKLAKQVHFASDGQGVDINLSGIEQPATPEKLQARGADLERLGAQTVALLAAVSGADTAGWSSRLAPGGYPPLVRCACQMADGSPVPKAFATMMISEGTLRFSLAARNLPAGRQQPSAGGWDAVHAAVRGLHEAVMGIPLNMEFSPMLVEVDEHGWHRYHCDFSLAPA